MNLVSSIVTLHEKLKIEGVTEPEFYLSTTSIVLIFLSTVAYESKLKYFFCNAGRSSKQDIFEGDFYEDKKSLVKENTQSAYRFIGACHSNLIIYLFVFVDRAAQQRCLKEYPACHRVIILIRENTHKGHCCSPSVSNI